MIKTGEYGKLLATLSEEFSKIETWDIDDLHLKFKAAVIETGPFIKESVTIYKLNPTKNPKNVLELVFEVFGLRKTPIEVHLSKKRIALFPQATETNLNQLIEEIE